MLEQFTPPPFLGRQLNSDVEENTPLQNLVIPVQLRCAVSCSWKAGRHENAFSRRIMYKLYRLEDLIEFMVYCWGALNMTQNMYILYSVGVLDMLFCTV